jgi:hypothetical protein
MKKSTIYAISILMLAAPAIAEGRYVPMPQANPNSNGVWVLDTESGEVKFCIVNSVEAPAECAPWSLTPK